MKDKKVGIMTLALTLIALGVILTLNNFMSIDMAKTLRLLAALSIIALGVEFIMMEWTNRKREEKVRLKISGLCIFVLVIIYSVSSIIPIGFVINKDNIYFNGWSLFNHRYEYTYERTYEEDVDGLTKFAVRNHVGDIAIIPTETGKVIINATIRVAISEEDETKAETLADETIHLKSSGDILELSATRYYNNTSVSIDYTISVPSNLMTTVMNNNGDVQVKGVKEVVLENRYGDVMIQDIAGNVALNSRNGDITVKNVGASLSVDNSYGRVRVTTINGNTKIDNKNGDIEVEDISGNLDIENRYDDIDFYKVKGNVAITHQNGAIKGEQVGKSVEIRTNYASVKLNQVDGNVTVETKNEDVTLTDIGGRVEVENQSGKVIGKNIGQEVSIKNNNGMIKLEDVTGKVEVQTQHDDIELINIDAHINVIQQGANVTLEDIDGDMDIENKNGNITIKNKDTTLQNVDIENEHGNVSIDTPRKQEGKFVIYTKHGKIKTNKDLSIDEDNSEKTINETIGSGENTISIRVNNGNITIE